MKGRYSWTNRSRSTKQYNRFRMNWKYSIRTINPKFIRYCRL